MSRLGLGEFIGVGLTRDSWETVQENANTARPCSLSSTMDAFRQGRKSWRHGLLSLSHSTEWQDRRLTSLSANSRPTP